MEPTLEQCLELLFNLAQQASAPAKVHVAVQKAFEALKKELVKNEKTTESFSK